ncbi:hypothetical protein MF271_06675 [Deinococcus sp. KNUC1210]|uniref:hypothetical protein n=1 Tax=Deinococcus sp. KNUC1210 TaxID=2917691 RepID=UPI001EF050C5|nr:hypothetical protein [Deinococcus sp. KNUC1210]ULH16286.1 hypothetical protein MF271_06675 [Deinococcus sp. KNUC1210]
MTDDPNAHLITRDPDQMEHQLKEADYAGSLPNDETLSDLDSGLLEVRVGNVGGLAAGLHDPLEDANANPDYTPPSQMPATHPKEGVADLPAGAPAEVELEGDLGKRD